MSRFGHQHPLATVSPHCRAKAGNCIVANILIAFPVKQCELAPLSSEPETRSALVVRGHEKKHFATRACAYANASA